MGRLGRSAQGLSEGPVQAFTEQRVPIGGAHIGQCIPVLPFLLAWELVNGLPDL